MTSAENDRTCPSECAEHNHPGREHIQWLADEDPFYNHLCNCDSERGRFGAHRDECPTTQARRKAGWDGGYLDPSNEATS